MLGTMEEDGFVDFSALLHCAVYALVRKGVVVYIGQSKMLCNRLYNHCHNRGKKPTKKPWYGTAVYNGVMFDAIWVRPCMLAELSLLEVQMIRKYQPKYNVNHKERPKPDISLEALLATMPPVLMQSAPLLPPCPEPRSHWRRL